MRVFITGANRGLGLELTRQLLTRGDEVIATCRDPREADELRKLAAAHEGQASVLRLDVRDDEAVAAVTMDVGPLDWLINNAGVNPRASFDAMTAARLLDTLDVNAVGALRLIQALRPVLKDGGRVVNISSQLGSLTRQAPGFGTLDYNASKAAMNVLTRQAAFAMPRQIVLSIHPGWVRTDMGGAEAALDVVTSARGVIAVAEGATPDDSGGFFTYVGEPHPW